MVHRRKLETIALKVSTPLRVRQTAEIGQANLGGRKLSSLND